MGRRIGTRRGLGLLALALALGSGCRTTNTGQTSGTRKLVGEIFAPGEAAVIAELKRFLGPAAGLELRYSKRTADRHHWLVILTAVRRGPRMSAEALKEARRRGKEPCGCKYTPLIAAGVVHVIALQKRRLDWKVVGHLHERRAAATRCRLRIGVAFTDHDRDKAPDVELAISGVDTACPGVRERWTRRSSLWAFGPGVFVKQLDLGVARGTVEGVVSGEDYAFASPETAGAADRLFIGAPSAGAPSLAACAAAELSAKTLEGCDKRIARRLRWDKAKRRWVRYQPAGAPPARPTPR